MIQKLIKQYQQGLQAQKLPEGVPTIHVDEVASKVAALYEKIRQIIDWKEEHLIRRTAIERILKRMLLSEISGALLVSDLDSGEIAESLVAELVRGGHFPNDAVPRSKIAEVERVLAKCIYILGNCPEKDTLSGSKKAIDLYHWLLPIAACEVETVLAPPVREEALIECMTTLVAKAIWVDSDYALPDAEKWVQTYIAVHRTLFHLDSPMIAFHLLRYHYPDWGDLPQSHLEQVTRDIFAIAGGIEGELNHPLAGHFSAVCERYDTVYLLLGDILGFLSDEPERIPEKFADPKALENLMKTAYRRRLKTLKSRLFRMAVYSTLSIFLGCALSLFIVEVPLAKLFYGRFSSFAVVVDILIPTALMFLLVALVKPPAEENLKRVITEARKVIYQEGKDVYEIRVHRERRVLMDLFIKLLFIAFTVLSLGTTVFIFYLPRIPATSIAIDTANVAVVVGAALLIRQRAKELTVGEEKRGFLTLLFDSLTVPLAKFGSWLSARWREFTSASIIFTALLDMPFLAFIDFVESWSQFVKEQKAGIR